MAFLDSSGKQCMANIELCPDLNATKTVTDKLDISMQSDVFSGNYAHFNM